MGTYFFYRWSANLLINNKIQLDLLLNLLKFCLLTAEKGTCIRKSAHKMLLIISRDKKAKFHQVPPRLRNPAVRREKKFTFNQYISKIRS